MAELHLYTQDCGYRGSLVVVAKSEAEARKLMAHYPLNYNPSDPVVENEIKDGFIFCNYGDC